jgi:K+ transporter
MQHARLYLQLNGVFAAAVFQVLLHIYGRFVLTAAGVVVVFVMLITTLLVSLVMLVVWRWHPLAVLAVFAPLCAIDGVFLSAVLYQVCYRGPLSVLTSAQRPFPIVYVSARVLLCTRQEAACL